MVPSFKFITFRNQLPQSFSRLGNRTLWAVTGTLQSLGGQRFHATKSKLCSESGDGTVRDKTVGKTQFSCFVFWERSLKNSYNADYHFVTVTCVILFSSRRSSWAIIVCAMFAGHCSAQQFTPLVANSDSECALLLDGPGRTSAFDYNLNALRGTL
jgi:hypothetical protein